MKKALLVARWEFVTTVARGSFIFAVVAMPLFYGVMFGIAALTGRSAAASNTNRAPAAVVDRARVVDLAAAAERAVERDRERGAAVDEAAAVIGNRSTAATTVLDGMRPTAGFSAYGDLDAALADLKAKKVSAVYVLESDYLNTGQMTSYTRDSGLFSIQADRQRQTQLADAVRAGLLKDRVAGDELDRIFSPIGRVRRMELDDAGTFKQATASSAFSMFAGSFGVFFLLTMTIFFSAGFLQQATIADRQNRMIEILQSSATADELVLGKLLGLAGAGLLQVTLYLALIILPGAALFSIFQVSAVSLATSLLFFVLGYLMFATLMTATGMLGRTPQESAQISTLWMLLASVPWFFVASIGAAPNGGVARVLSFFPLTSAVTMMMRTSSTTVAPLELGAVVLVNAAALYLVFRAAAKIFRASTLMYGKRTTLPELVRWLREA